MNLLSLLVIGVVASPFPCALCSLQTVLSPRIVPLHWNKESNIYGNYDRVPITKKAKIICIAKPNDAGDDLLYHPDTLPEGSEILATVSSLEELKKCQLLSECNAIYCSLLHARDMIEFMLSSSSPSAHQIEWIHLRSTGVDRVHCPTLADWDGGIVTNAKGQFSSTLAEYCMGVMTYFAKDFSRLRRNQGKKRWDKFSVSELRGATIGIIGFGDIGKATARLAKAHGMHVLALGRRRPVVDGILADEGFDQTQLEHVLERSDYVVMAAPLTKSTEGMMGREQFHRMKRGSVFINVGRGRTVDETALIEVLTSGHLKGAGLDVFCVEPLPQTSELWDLDNVLLSSHNMPQTDTFMHESAEFFCREQLSRFVRGLPLYNVVDHASGY